MYYFYTMQKSTKIALISGSIIAISVGAYLVYRKKKQEQNVDSGVISDLQKIYNQLLAKTRSGAAQSGTQTSQGTGQDESQRQPYKEPSTSQPSTQTSQTQQKQADQQKKQQEEFFKPKDQQPQPANKYNDAQYALPPYQTGGADYGTGGYQTGGGYGGYGYGSGNWYGGTGTGWGYGTRLDRGYGGNISDY